MIQSVNITELVGKMTPTKVALSLPKFTLDFDITLNEVMKKMGMVDAFDQGRADFTNMSEDAELYLSLIKVNRPFIFTIEDNSIENISIFYAKITSIKE